MVMGEVVDVAVVEVESQDVGVERLPIRGRLQRQLRVADQRLSASQDPEAAEVLLQGRLIRQRVADLGIDRVALSCRQVRNRARQVDRGDAIDLSWLRRRTSRARWQRRRDRLLQPGGRTVEQRVEQSARELITGDRQEHPHRHEHLLVRPQEVHVALLVGTLDLRDRQDEVRRRVRDAPLTVFLRVLRQLVVVLDLVTGRRRLIRAVGRDLPDLRVDHLHRDRVGTRGSVGWLGTGVGDDGDTCGLPRRAVDEVRLRYAERAARIGVREAKPAHDFVGRRAGNGRTSLNANSRDDDGRLLLTSVHRPTAGHGGARAEHQRGETERRGRQRVSRRSVTASSQRDDAAWVVGAAVVARRCPTPPASPSFGPGVGRLDRNR